MNHPQNKLSRRGFLSGAAAAAGSTLFTGTEAALAGVEWRNRQSGMTYRRLGRTGLMVSSMGMGGDDIRPTRYDQVLYAIDFGLNYLDTSPRYANGLSEQGYALVIQARGREKVFLTSKVADEVTRDSQAYHKIFESLPAAEQQKYRSLVRERILATGVLKRDYMGHYFPGQDRHVRDAVLHNLLAEQYADRIQRKTGYKEEILASVEDSLRRLQTDYLDCLLCPHGVDTPYEVTNHPEVFDAFETLRRQGKVRFFGLSAHSDPAGVLNAAVESGQYSMAMVAYNFINHQHIDPVLEKARKADFVVLAMKASRVLQNPFRRTNLVPDRVKAIHDLMPGGDLTPFQKGFKWALANDKLSGVVAGISDMEMAKQDLPLAMKAS